LPIQLLNAKTSLQCPTDVHPQKQRREILRIDSTSTGLNRHNRSATPLWFGRRIRVRNVPNMCLDKRNIAFGRDKRIGIAFLKGESNKATGVVKLPLNNGHPVDLSANKRSLGKEPLCTLAVAPKIGCC
jgi:hypothetical protein